MSDRPQMPVVINTPNPQGGVASTVVPLAGVPGQGDTIRVGGRQWMVTRVSWFPVSANAWDAIAGLDVVPLDPPAEQAQPEAAPEATPNRKTRRQSAKAAKADPKTN